MITAIQAQQYLDQVQGISVPGFLIDAAVARVATVEAAMVAAGYSEVTRTLVQTFAVAIIAAAGSPRRISSQGAPSGASRSFKNADNSLTVLRRELGALDTAGTVTDLIGPDPAQPPAFMMAICG